MKSLYKIYNSSRIFKLKVKTKFNKIIKLRKKNKNLFQKKCSKKIIFLEKKR